MDYTNVKDSILPIVDLLTYYAVTEAGNLKGKGTEHQIQFLLESGVSHDEIIDKVQESLTASLGF